MSSAPMAMSTEGGLVRFAGPQIAYRDTRDGRRLMYECAVIQQPERARACGSGAKCEFFWDDCNNFASKRAFSCF